MRIILDITSDNDDTLSFKGIVISLKSRAVMKLYFDSERELSEFSIMAGTKAVSDSRLSIGTDAQGFYLAVSGISPADFDTGYTVYCGNLTVRNVSVFSYIRQALTSSQSNLIDVVCSIYDYNRAVETYLAARRSN